MRFVHSTYYALRIGEIDIIYFTSIKAIISFIKEWEKKGTSKWLKYIKENYDILKVNIKSPISFITFYTTKNKDGCNEFYNEKEIINKGELFIFLNNKKNKEN